MAPPCRDRKRPAKGNELTFKGNYMRVGINCVNTAKRLQATAYDREGELTKESLFSDFFFLITDWIISTSARLSRSKCLLELLWFRNSNSSAVFVTSRSHNSDKVRLSISLESIGMVIHTSSCFSLALMLQYLSKMFHNSHIGADVTSVPDP